MWREPVCADKWRGKEIVFLRHFPRTSTKTSVTRTSNANRFKIFYHVDLPDYFDVCTRRPCQEMYKDMPEARAELLY